MQWERRGWTTVGGWGAIVAAIPILLCCAPSATPADRFDYHSVRGRRPSGSTAQRREGEADLIFRGTSRVQPMRGFGDLWSGHAQLLWDGVIGDTMETSFNVESAGLHRIVIQCTVAPDYGLFEVTIPHTDVRATIDLYSTAVGLAPPLLLEHVFLPAGPCEIAFKLTGAHRAARPFQETRFLLGLDHLDLVPETPAVPASGEGATSSQPTIPSATEVAAVPLSSDEFTAASKQFCVRCHGGDTTEGDLDLTSFGESHAPPPTAGILQQIRDRIAYREMPPENEPSPDDNVRRRLVNTLDGQIREYLHTHDLGVPVVMRRLNRYEYNNAVRDLLHLRGDIYPLPEKTIRIDSPYFNPASGRFPDELSVRNRALGKEHIENQILTGVTPFAIDLQAEGGFNNRGSELGMSPVLLESLLALGTTIVDSPEFDGYCGSWDTLFAAPPLPPSGQPPTTLPEAVARERLARLLEVAFRCRIDDELLDRYHRAFIDRWEATGSFPRAMKDAVAAVLASPRFIYLAEAAATAGKTPLDGYELATRLSFFLWSSLPDEALLAVARDGSLLQDDVLDKQVERMLADPRSRALADNFARQWLRLDRMVAAAPDFDRFPHYYARIGCEQWKFGVLLMVEPLLLFESILVEDRSIMLLVDSNYTYRCDDLQEWYGDAMPFATRANENRFGAWSAQHFRRRPLDDRRQGGVLTSAAVLTMTSSPLRTNPITRGAWVATVILNRPPPPPPDDIPPIEKDDRAIESLGLTLRQRLTAHQTNASCAACHARIDPLGFVLENYDAVGRWREKYPSGLEIDSTGQLFGELPFADIVGLKDQLLDHPEIFFRAFSEQLLSYAIGRRLDVNDTPAVDRIVARVEADHGQFSTVVRGIVASPPFRQRSQGATVIDLPSTEKGSE